jgi:benzoate membrane transport protein
MTFFKDFSLSALIAGFVTVLVGITSSAVLVFQAAKTLGASPQQISSWIWALGIGKGIICILLSLRYRVPVVIAWSTPGAALLITTVAGASMSEAIGAFVISAVLITLSGYLGWFERAMNRIPLSLASGMLAGVLLRFGMDTFLAMKTNFVLAFAMFCAYLVLRRFLPRYSIIIAFALGVLIASVQGELHLNDFQLEWAKPIFTMPQFTLGAMIGIALPLFVVTMASQNVPGVAVMRASGYQVPLSPVIGSIGLVNILIAPFGGFAINLAAITAAICMGNEVHEDRNKRYVAAIVSGVFYILLGVFGATLAAFFASFPKELVAGIAGLALIGTIGNGLLTALTHEHERESALITFLVTASGVTLGGIGSAFWGIVAGVFALLILRWGKKQ